MYLFYSNTFFVVSFAKVEYKQDLATPSSPGLVSALPEECIREILLRLSDPRDLEQASKTCETMKAVASEKRVWRELVQTHFTKMQVSETSTFLFHFFMCHFKKL